MTVHANRRIPYGRQDISDSDIQAVVEVLKSDWLTQGPAIENFEKKVADFCGAKYAVAVSNATAGLHIAYQAAGIQSGSRVWTSPNTFVASANAALYCGAEVDFVDIDPRTYNLSIEALEAKLLQAERNGKLPDLVVPVHFAGHSCEMDRLSDLSNRYGFKIIEDAAHAVGGRFKGSPVGACNFSEAVVFSFHPVKIITTGEGGMILTNREELYQRLVRLRSHGITRNPGLMTRSSEGPWYYQQLELGYNFRITDLQAALGSSQMDRLDQFVKRRHELAKRYDRAFSDLGMQCPWHAQDVYSAYHLYVIRLHTDRLKRSRREIFDELLGQGIGVNVHYIPVHLQPYYQTLGFNAGDFPEAERYYSEAITLPLYSGLSEADQDRVIRAVREAVR